MTARTPDPSATFAGLDLMWHMGRDMLNAQAQWKRRFGDVAHLPLVHEHQIIVSDPERVRQLLVTQHAALIRWERGIQAFSQLHGRGVLVAEGAARRAKRRALQPAFTPNAVH